MVQNEVELEWTGERAVIDSKQMPDRVREEHIKRYEFACKFVYNKRVLDIACGSGYGSNVMAKAGSISVLGIDVDEETIQHCQQLENNKLSFQVGNAESIELSSDSFDLIVSFETIEHLDDPLAFISSLNKVLTQKGKLIISTPNRHILTPLYWIKRKPTNSFHKFELSRKEFIKMLSAYFRVEQLYGQRLRWNIVNWWPFLCTLKAISLVLSREDRLYTDKVKKCGNSGVLPSTFFRTGMYMIALCSKKF